MLGGERQVVVAQTLAHVTGQHGQAWEGHLWATHEYGAVGSLGDHWQIREQRPQFRAGSLWHSELAEIIKLNV